MFSTLFVAFNFVFYIVLMVSNAYQQNACKHQIACRLIFQICTDTQHTNTWHKGSAQSFCSLLFLIFQFIFFSGKPTQTKTSWRAWLFLLERLTNIAHLLTNERTIWPIQYCSLLLNDLSKLCNHNTYKHRFVLLIFECIQTQDILTNDPQCTMRDISWCHFVMIFYWPT